MFQMHVEAYPGFVSGDNNDVDEEGCIVQTEFVIFTIQTPKELTPCRVLGSQQLAITSTNY